jgi:hypothetical protein
MSPLTRLTKTPNTLNDGLCVDVMGSNAGPADPKHDPRQLLEDALQVAHIEKMRR